MTSLEGVPHHAVMLPDLGIQVPVGSSWLPLLAPANGTLILRVTLRQLPTAPSRRSPATNATQARATPA